MTIQTGFEVRAADPGAINSFTTIAEETTFRNALLSASDRVSARSVGTTHENRTLWHYTVAMPGGTPVAERPALFMIGLQHGNEPAPREGLFMWMRDLALTTDPAIIAHLQEVAWHFMPTCNPDNLRTNTGGGRNNKLGLDPNRGHYSCASNHAEASAIQSVMRDIRPVITFDAHEAGTLNFPEGIQFLEGENTQAYSAVRTMSELLRDYLVAGIIEYGSWSQKYIPPNTTPSTGNARNVCLLRHSISILAETTMPPGESDVERPRWPRALLNLESCKLIMQFYESHKEAILSATRDSVRLKRIEGRNATAGWNFQNGSTLATQPRAYRLSVTDYSSASRPIVRHGISSYEVSGQRYLLMGQRAQTVIPFLFDTLSTHTVRTGTRITNPPVPMVRVNGVSSVGSVRRNLSNHPNGRFIVGAFNA